MRWRPIILNFALLVVVWATVLRIVRQGRTRMAADASPREVRSHRLHTVAAISATVGVTWFSAWLITDATGPHWLHTLSAPGTLIFIVVGVALAGYTAWVSGP